MEMGAKREAGQLGLQSGKSEWVVLIGILVLSIVTFGTALLLAFCAPSFLG